MMPEAQSTRASPRASTPAKAVRKCKACQSCREKKIKCDGHQPNCAQCRQQGSTCKYGQDRRQTSRVTKGSIDTVYSKIASLESMLKRSLESTTQHPALPVTQTALPPLSPQPSVPSPLVEIRSASPANSLNNNSFFSHSIYTGDAPSHAFDTGRPLHGNDYVGNTSSRRESLPAPSTVCQEGQSGAHTTNGLGGSAVYSAATPNFTKRNEGAKTSWNAPDSRNPASCSSTDHRRVATDQDSSNNDKMVSGIHIRVSNSVHGLTSAFHPQPSTPQTSWSGSPAQPPSEGQESQAQREHRHDDEKVRNRLFMYAASQKQLEYAYRAEQKYDFDGIDSETALHLLELHWNHQHNAYLFSYKPAILHSLATGGQHANKLLLNALYYSSTLNSDRSSLREPGPDGESMSDKFLVRFQELVLPELQTSRISSAVAFMQMGSSLFANGKQTAGWLYTGIGYRMIVDLGLHLDPGKIQSPGSDNSMIDDTEYFVEVELQRRVFWGAYVNDKFQSLFFGRPPALPLTGAEPPPTFSDTYEELELWSPYVDPQNPSSLQLQFSPKPGHVVSTFKWLIRLAKISSDITEYLYTPAICKMKRPSVLQHFSRIKDDLHRWSQELPAYLRFEPEKDPAPPAHQFNIHTTYCTLNILLHRPFLPEGHLSHFCADEMSARETCVWAALRIYRLAVAYRDTFTLRRAPYLFSYALFCAATVIPNHDGSELACLSRKEITIFFWNSLIELQKGSNLGLSRPLKIIRDFMERAGVDVQSLTVRFGTQPSSPAAAGQGGSLEANRPQHFSDTSGFSFDSNDFKLADLNIDNIDWSNDMGNLGFGENEDMLYGLFRSS